ncbi:MAG: hypothetical protein ACI9N1_001127 [Flavobacteriales bacterium]|jgi:hypothetical protein
MFASSHIWKKIITVSLFFLFLLSGRAQQGNLPLNFELNQRVALLSTQQDQLIHLGARPYQRINITDELYLWSFEDTSKFYYDLTLLMFKRHALQIEKEDVFLTADPLFDFAIGRSFEAGNESSNRIFSNVRGLRVGGDITSKFSFETFIYENQFFYPQYIDSLADARGVAPGIGRSKPFKTTGHDVGMSSGYISLAPTERMNIQFGHNKFFVGHGYRSLLVSDVAANYPMLKFSLISKNRKWMYHSAKAWMQSLTRLAFSNSTEALFVRKGGAMNYLSFKPNTKLELGFFESTIHKNYVDSIGVIPLDYTFYIPVIGVSTLINGLDGANNSLIGVTGSYFLANDMQLYGQLAIDKLDKMGWQLGAKWFNPLGMKRSWLLVEVNTVPQYMYTQSKENIYQNYSHVSQELAHPIGAGFSEVLIHAHWEKNHWYAHLNCNYSLRKRNDGSTQGENILLINDDQDLTHSTEKVKVLYLNLELGYSLNIKTNMQIYLAGTKRTLNGTISNQSESFVNFGFRTNLRNNYLDI